jgi:REP element-mobilizing transposase RayT
MKKLRLKNYDYTTNGYYFVTICTNYQKPLLTESNRNVVARFIEQTRGIPGVDIDYYIIMPTHLHLILVLDNCNFKLGEIIRRFKAKTSKEIGIRMWQPNYYEHVIRNEKALQKIREYIENNPEAQKIKIECINPPDESGNYNDR